MPHRAPIAPVHAYQHSDRDRQRRKRDTALGPLYDSVQWRRRTRPAVLARDPFCTIGVLCGGHAASTDVDHVIRAEVYVAQHNGDARAFFDLANLRGACHADHSRKTSLELRGEWHEPRAEG